RRAARAGDLGLRDHVIFVFVVRGETFLPRDGRYLFPRLILREPPAVDVEIFIIVTRNRLHLASKTTNPPNSLSVRNRVSRKLKRLGNDDLLRALFWLIHDRRRITGDHNRSLDFPLQLAAVF